MTAVIPGQVDALDLLEPKTRPAPRSAPAAPQPRFVPSPDNPVHCVCCGKELTTWFAYDVNHHPMGWQDGQRLCTGMNLTMNHIRYYAMRIRAKTTGEYPAHWNPEDSTQCCYGKHDLHGKAVRKPTVMQMADHLRERIDRARQTWGLRTAEFDTWCGGYLHEQGVLKYALDPKEYPWEFEGDS